MNRHPFCLGRVKRWLVHRQTAMVHYVERIPVHIASHLIKVGYASCRGLIIPVLHLILSSTSCRRLKSVRHPFGTEHWLLRGECECAPLYRFSSRRLARSLLSAVVGLFRGFFSRFRHYKLLPPFPRGIWGWRIKFIRFVCC